MLLLFFSGFGGIPSVRAYAAISYSLTTTATASEL